MTILIYAALFSMKLFAADAVNVLPADPNLTAEIVDQGKSLAVPLVENSSENCKVQNGESARMIWRAFVFDHVRSGERMIDVVAVETASHCSLFFGRIRPESNLAPMPYQLVGDLSKPAEGLVSVSYEKYGSGMEERARQLALRLEGEAAHIANAPSLITID